MTRDPKLAERTRNILRVYRAATLEERAEGACWYAKAHLAADVLGARNRVSTWQAAGIIAALSPQVPWTRNLELAERCCEAWARGEQAPNGGAYPANVRKAERIYFGADPDSVLGGFKVRAFYQLLAGAWADPYSGIVCIDGHAVNVAEYRLFHASTDVKWRSSYAWYQDYARAYRAAARRVGVPGHAMQAATWLAWRRIQKED